LAIPRASPSRRGQIEGDRGKEPRRLVSVAIGFSVAGPDEREVFAVLVIEEIGVDGGVEARTVHFDRAVGAVLGGTLGPRGADFDTSDVNAVARGVVACPAGFGDDADVFRMNAEGDDFAEGSRRVRWRSR